MHIYMFIGCSGTAAHRMHQNKMWNWKDVNGMNGRKEEILFSGVDELDTLEPDLHTINKLVLLSSRRN